MNSGRGSNGVVNYASVGFRAVVYESFGAIGSVYA